MRSMDPDLADWLGIPCPSEGYLVFMSTLITIGFAVVLSSGMRARWRETKPSLRERIKDIAVIFVCCLFTGWVPLFAVVWKILHG